MRLLITGGTGYAGGFLVAEALAAGDQVTLLSRTAPDLGTKFQRLDWQAFDLAAPPARLPKADALIHAAFDHLPGRYRGGEGTDPDGFLHRNLTGSQHLFRAAAEAGIGAIVFLSSRAVYGDHPAGTLLDEALPPRPDTLYGKMKLDVEQYLAQLSSSTLLTVSLRATGLYGQARPGAWHKWKDLFAAFERAAPVAPRQATEVHGRDLAQAVRLCLSHPPGGIAAQALNVSDLLLDRRDLLRSYAAARGLTLTPPDRDRGPGPNVMPTDRLRGLGWVPRGHAGLAEFLGDLADYSGTAKVSEAQCDRQTGSSSLPPSTA